MKNKSKNWFANGNAFISLPVILITLLVFVPMISSSFYVFPVGTADNDVIQRFGKLSADAE